MRTMADLRTGPMLATASLGELLVASRSDAGLTIDEVSRASGLAADRVAAVEGGRHDLSDVELSMLLDRYPIPSPSRRFTRTVVEIDLDGGSLRLQHIRRPRPVPAADRNLLQYLAMVHRHYRIELGTEIPLKAVDLSLLRASLALRRDQVESRLDRMSGGVGSLSVRNRSLLAAAVATGVAVAAGAIVLIPSGSSPEPSAPAPASQIDIGTPLVVERDPADIPAPGSTADPTVEADGGGVDESEDAAANLDLDLDLGVDAGDLGATPVRPEPVAVLSPVRPIAGSAVPIDVDWPTSANEPPTSTVGDTRSRGPPPPKS